MNLKQLKISRNKKNKMLSKNFLVNDNAAFVRNMGSHIIDSTSLCNKTNYGRNFGIL
jgi:hypothetical protein